MVTAQSDGMLKIFPFPAPHNGAGGAAGSAVDVSCPIPGGDVHQWQPRSASVRAHKGTLTSATALVCGVCV